jgi:Zn-dependent oligopeptidase
VSKRIAFFLIAMVFAVPQKASASADGIDWQMNAATLTSTCNASVAKLKSRVAAIVRARSARTFSTVVLPLENAEADLNDATVAQTFLFNV